MGNVTNNKDFIWELSEGIAKLAAVVVGIVLAYNTLIPISPYLAQWLVWFVAFYVVIFILRKKRIQSQQKLSKILIISLSIAAIFLAVLQLRDYVNVNKKKRNLSQFESKLKMLRWIVYEPIAYDPDLDKYSTIGEIRNELSVLFQAGFNGIITIESGGLICNIPQLAKEIGFHGMIMGVFDVTKAFEIRCAIKAAPYVDAYCVGNMFTDYPFNEINVLDAMKKISEKTNLPVSTTLRPNGYRVFPKIAVNCDWFFPDVHGNWYTQASAEEIFDQTKRYLKEISLLQMQYPDKPVLLKFISFPSAEVENASPLEQYKFFRLLIEYVEGSMDFPDRVYPSYFSAFDISWKTPDRGFPKGERYLGFFTSERKAKTVVIDGKKINTVQAIFWRR